MDWWCHSTSHGYPSLYSSRKIQYRTPQPLAPDFLDSRLSSNHDAVWSLSWWPSRVSKRDSAGLPWNCSRVYSWYRLDIMPFFSGLLISYFGKSAGFDQHLWYSGRRFVKGQFRCLCRICHNRIAVKEFSKQNLDSSSTLPGIKSIQKRQQRRKRDWLEHRF